MSNRRGLTGVLSDLAAEFQSEHDEIRKADEGGRGYSEGAREELLLRVRACRAGAAAIEYIAALATDDDNGETKTPAV